MSQNSPSDAFHFDLELVLRPISPDAPGGEDLRYEGTYDRIKLLRQEDDPELRQGVWQTTLRKADWKTVEKDCLQSLETKSKDAQLAAWLLEAWVHMHGFTGLSEGFRLLAALCDRFWDTMFPQIPNGDIDYRISPFVWLNEKVPLVLKLIPITAPQSEDVLTYCWADWETACRPRRGEEPKTANARITQAIFQQSAMLTPTAVLRSTLRHVDEALAACLALETVLNRCFGAEAPSLRQFPTTLEPLKALLMGIVSQRPDDIPPDSPEEIPTMSHPNPAAPTSAEPPDSPSLSHSGPIRSRAEAYMRLEEAASYLARTEPHSPTPYLVKRAIAWGSMRLEDLLPELVKNRGELGVIFELLQIPKDPGG
jgi:type VI secretion system protein ImpA